MSRQASEEGFKRVDCLDAPRKPQAEKLAADDPCFVEDRFPAWPHQDQNGGVVAEGHQVRAGICDGVFCLGGHVRRVLVDDAALSAEDLAKKPSCPLLPLPPVGAEDRKAFMAIECNEPRRKPEGYRKGLELGEDVGIRLGWEALDRHNGDELSAHLGRVAAVKFLTA